MSEHEDQVGSPTQEEHVVSCIKAIDNYSEHNISKWEAVAQISTALRSPTASVNNDQRATAGETYLAMLDEHDQMLANASSHGHQGLDQVDSGGSEQEEFVGEAKHSQSWGSSPSSKWHKIDELLYAWKISETITPTTLSPNLECTHTMVQNYTADLKHTVMNRE